MKVKTLELQEKELMFKRSNALIVGDISAIVELNQKIFELRREISDVKTCL